VRKKKKKLVTWMPWDHWSQEHISFQLFLVSQKRKKSRREVRIFSISTKKKEKEKLTFNKFAHRAS